MKGHPSNIFTTVRSEGAILPSDLLQRIVSGDKALDGLDAKSFHLLEGDRINEAINRSWSRLRGAWVNFQHALTQLSSDDAATRLTREKFLLPLFQELGYGRLPPATAIAIGDKRYAISHGWHHTPIHLVGYRVDLDKRSAGIAGASKSSPHSLVQELLNRSNQHLWAFLANGRRLRILRDNASLTRQAYVEFDLEAMMAGEVYADFVLLWLLCHQSRVEVRESGIGNRESGAASTPDSRLSTPHDCWLEKWSQVADSQGTRALEQLRKGVEVAISTLGQGFLSHPANQELRRLLQTGALSAQEYNHQLRRLVYRLLFLFVVEDRDVLLDPAAAPEAKERYQRYYSVNRLRSLADRHRGTRHHDLYQGLQVVMQHLGREGCPALGLPALGSFLWSNEATPALTGNWELGIGNRGQEKTSSHSPDSPLPTPDSPSSSPSKLANVYLLDAIRALAFICDRNGRRPVDYKNLQSRELGSIYESLLELHPQLNIGAGTFKLKTAEGNSRKTTGCYYTPESLVQKLLDTTLEPVLEKTIQAAKQRELEIGNRESRIGNRIQKRTFSQVPDSLLPTPDSPTSLVEEAILNLKICDTACGSGHFLTAAAQRVAKRLAAIRTGEEEPGLDAVRTALRQVISCCIYGVDVNRMAVELCKVALWMEAMEPGKPLPFLEHHIQWGNSLIGATPALMARGIPDDAFKPIRGDDKALCRDLKRQNKREREQAQLTLVDPSTRPWGWLEDMAAYAPEHQPWQQLEELAALMAELDGIPDETIAQVQLKQQKYKELLASTEYRFSRFRADSWCAAFVWIKRSPSDEEANRGIANRGVEGSQESLLAASYSSTHSPEATRSTHPTPDSRLPTSLPYALTEEVFRKIKQNPYNAADWLWGEVENLQSQYSFFHWHVTFAHIFRVPKQAEAVENEQAGWSGGFDVELGNTPWERIKVQEREWFAAYRPDISNAVNATERKRKIQALKTEDPYLYLQFTERCRQSDGESHFIHHSGKYPLCGRGDINTFAVFAEINRLLLQPNGRLGCIVPSSMATADTTKYFFQDLMASKALVSYYDFENRAKIFFPAVDSRMRFALMTLSGSQQPVEQADFVFFAHRIEDLAQSDRHIHLTLDDINLLNPGTKTCPTFRSQREFAITRQIYQTIPVLGQSDHQGNRWQLRITQGLFSQTADISLLQPTTAVDPDQTDLIRCYEARMISRFNHREGSAGITDKNTFRTGVSIPISDEERTDPHFLAQSRYWASLQDTAQRLPKDYPYQWLMGFKDVTSATNTRTMIACVLPKTAVLCSIRVVFLEDYNHPSPPTPLPEVEGSKSTSSSLSPRERARVRATEATGPKKPSPPGISILLSLLANWNSFCFDFFCRQSTPGNHLSDYIIRQLPTLPPSTYQQPCPWDATLTVEDWILPRVLELTYTAWDLQGFAKDIWRESGVGNRESIVQQWEQNHGKPIGSVLSRLEGLADGDGPGRNDLLAHPKLPEGRNLRNDFSDAEGIGVDSGEHRRGIRSRESGGVYPVPQDRSGLSQRVGDTFAPIRSGQTDQSRLNKTSPGTMRLDWENAAFSNSLTPEQNLEALITTPDSPLPIPPFSWNLDRRSWLQAELDAAFFHFYNIQRKDVGFMLESFPIVKRKDRQKFGSFQSKARILRIYDQLTAAMQSGVAYHSDLDPPPGSPVPSPLGRGLG
jgi:hypothetical protein